MKMKTSMFLGAAFATLLAGAAVAQTVTPEIDGAQSITISASDLDYSAGWALNAQRDEGSTDDGTAIVVPADFDTVDFVDPSALRGEVEFELGESTPSRDKPIELVFAKGPTVPFCATSGLLQSLLCKPAAN